MPLPVTEFNIKVSDSDSLWWHWLSLDTPPPAMTLRLPLRPGAFELTGRDWLSLDTVAPTQLMKACIRSSAASESGLAASHWGINISIIQSLPCTFCTSIISCAKQWQTLPPLSVIITSLNQGSSSKIMGLHLLLL
jgi:hypothetical protein